MNLRGAGYSEWDIVEHWHDKLQRVCVYRMRRICGFVCQCSLDEIDVEIAARESKAVRDALIDSLVNQAERQLELSKAKAVA